MTTTKWAIFILSATVSCFVVLFVAVIIMIFKYRKKMQESESLVDSRTIKLKPCLKGEEKPYVVRLVQYLFGHREDDNADARGTDAHGSYTKMVHVQPCSDSELENEETRVRSQSALGNTDGLEIDSSFYRGRSYTDSPSPEGRKGIWRARESIFFKGGRSPGNSVSADEAELSDKASPRRNTGVDRMSKLLGEETRKVTGKPPLSPKATRARVIKPSKAPLSSLNFDYKRRFSYTNVLEDASVRSVPKSNLGRGGIGSSLGSFENLSPEMGSLDVSVYYNSDERLLKVCVVDVNKPNEQCSLVDTYIKLSFYLFEKPYKNEMQLWSDSAKSLVKRTFSYLVKDAAVLQRATLKFTLLRKNVLVKSKLLGKALLRLCGKDVVEPQAYTLKLKHSVSELYGELLVSVCHQATTGILSVGIVRAMDLAKTIRKSMGAPFVIVELKTASGPVFVKHTKQKSNKIHPLFEEKFDIPVSTDTSQRLEDFQLQITVLRYTFSGSNDIIGMIGLETGSSNPSEAEHWKEVTMNPHTTVMKWHRLRMP